MTAVMIGVDPAKRSHAMAVLDDREAQLAALQVGNDSAGFRDMLRLWSPRPGSTTPTVRTSLTELPLVT